MDGSGRYRVKLMDCSHVGESLIKGLEEFKEIEKVFEKSRKRNEPILALLWDQFTPSLQNRKLRIRGFLNTRPRGRGPGIPGHPMTVHTG